MSILSKYHTAKNYIRFLLSGTPAVYGDLPYSKEKVEQSFREKGIVPVPYSPDMVAYRAFVEKARYPEGEYGDYFAEKSLEHFVSFQFSSLTGQSLVVDVANAGSAFPQIIHDLFGCRVVSNDLTFPPGEVALENWHTRIGCNACHLPLADASVDLITLHCALEMFEGDDDKNMAKEASRLLKPGGKMVIIPLYMNEIHHVFRDPASSRRMLPQIDEGSVLIYRKNFWGVSFARFYSVDAFCDRFLANVDRSMKFNLFTFTAPESVDNNVYLSWIGVFEKQ